MANLLPPTAAVEIFDDDFQAEVIDLVRLDATEIVQAFESVVFSLAIRSQYIDRGLVPPLELVIAAPSGRHERREIADIPIALVHHPDEAGEYRYTLREQAHNRWWGSTTITVKGQPS